MASDVKQGTVKIWFGLLKMAIQQGLPINEDFYRPWGTREELASLSFNAWWKLCGKELFEGAIPKVTLVEALPDSVVVRIPTSLNSEQVKKQVSSLMARARGTKRIKQKSPLGFTGDVKYKRLKQYERYLGVEFDPKNAGKTIEEKTELLRQEYRRIKDRLDKQRKTLRDAKKGRVALKFQYRDPDAFGSESEIRKGIDAKKVSRWRLSGKLLLLNVAEGQFPGRDYYGSKLAERLDKRLKTVGVASLDMVAPNKGGGRNRSELRSQKMPTKAELKDRKALSDRLYDVDILGRDRRGKLSLGRRSGSF